MRHRQLGHVDAAYRQKYPFGTGKNLTLCDTQAILAPDVALWWSRNKVLSRKFWKGEIMFKDSFAKNSLCLLLTVNIFLVGCGGSAPNPVIRYMPGDEKKSCQGLFSEIAGIDGEIAGKENKIKQRDGGNVILFICGLFIIVPFFFMDCKGSYEVEIDALKARQTLLRSYFAENNCSVTNLSGQTSK